MNILTGENRDTAKLSVKLRNCLHLTGGSNDFIRYRISCFKSMEKMFALANVERGSLDGIYIGSQIEGGTLLGLDSDADMMFVDRDINIITDIEEYKCHPSNVKVCPEVGRSNLERIRRLENPPIGLICERDVTPGYAKIIALDRNTCLPVTRKDKSTLSHLFEEDTNGTFLFSHEKWKDRIALVTPSRYKHGPALSEDYTSEFKSSDFVYGLKSSFWPKSANEWITRQRSYHWPPPEIMDKTKRGCFLVPVGPLPNNISTEWRISFTILEREMIWTWSNIQYQCFMLMKIINREVIASEVTDVISSYHLKTTMFWMSEERPIEFWKKENFHICIVQCLEKLLEFIEKGECPNYFIKANNLFRGKLSDSVKNRLLTKLRRFIERFWSEVFTLPTLEKVLPAVGEADHECFTTLKSACFRNQDLLSETMNLHFSVLISFATSAVKPAYQLISNDDPEMSICKHKDYLNLIASTPINDEETKQLTESLCQVVNISLGCQWFAKSKEVQGIEDKKRMEKLSESLIRKGSGIDTSSGKLKLATILFFKGDLKTCRHLAHDVLSNEDIIKLSCFEPVNPDKVMMEYALRVINMQPQMTSEICEHCALDVMFLSSELAIAPKPIQFEICRAIAAEKDFDEDDPLRWVSIDAKFYALLLKFLVAHQENAIPVRNEALSAIRACVAERSAQFVCKMMELNIAGYCLQLIGELDWSIDVFLGSLILQRSHNAAAWHLALIIYNEWIKSLTNAND